MSNGRFLTELPLAQVQPFKGWLMRRDTRNREEEFTANTGTKNPLLGFSVVGRMIANAYILLYLLSLVTSPRQSRGLICEPLKAD